ncbi:hypothetical protein [Clostridium hydrogenum]|uniref:hypothetical protein n=1 Tax=Clostridium hydrogenum TaxID=2855764 RepID=UPI001F3DE1C5|nr:hypothetical protein [Clostridium hydrogenum]
MNNYICSWLFVEDEEDSSFYPQVGGKPSSEKFQKVYWKCIYDFYYSSLLFNKEDKHIFFTNVKELPSNVDGVNFNEFFNCNEIEIVNLNLTYKTPKDWFGAWRNQFYIFDILAYIEKKYEDSDKFLILDSDCVFVKKSDEIFEDIDTNKVIAYSEATPLDYRMNGITTIEMRQLYEKFYNEKSDVIYYGGEILAAKVSSIKLINEQYKFLWKVNFEQYTKKDIKLTEEAHFLSMIYHKIGVNNIVANNYIKRMWTTFKFNTVNKEDLNLVIWHLPAEKKTGFKYMFNKISKKKINLNEEDFVNLAKRCMGIYKRNFLKTVLDVIWLVKYKIESN